MKAFLTIWKSPGNFEVKTVDCKVLIIKDGPKIGLDGDYCQLFHVINADDIYHRVATIEVV